VDADLLCVLLESIDSVENAVTRRFECFNESARCDTRTRVRTRARECVGRERGIDYIGLVSDGRGLSELARDLASAAIIGMIVSSSVKF
jgi:hypothetical protein